MFEPGRIVSSATLSGSTPGGTNSKVRANRAASEGAAAVGFDGLAVEVDWAFVCWEMEARSARENFGFFFMVLSWEVEERVETGIQQPMP